MNVNLFMFWLFKNWYCNELWSISLFKFNVHLTYSLLENDIAIKYETYSKRIIILKFN